MKRVNVQWDLGSNPRSPKCICFMFQQVIPCNVQSVAHHIPSSNHLPDGLQAKSDGPDGRPIICSSQRATWSMEVNVDQPVLGPKFDIHTLQNCFLRPISPSLFFLYFLINLFVYLYLLTQIINSFYQIS